VSGRFVLGHDVGTSGTKTVLCDLHGRIVASAHQSYGLERPRSGRVEQDPDVLAAAVVRGSREVLRDGGASRRSVIGLGLSGQMFNVLALDHHGRALTPMLSWLDVRSAPQAEHIARSLDLDAQFDRFGNVFTAKDIVPKILWLRDEAPDVWRRSAVFVDCKDYVNARLTGRVATDLAGASATFLFDVVKHEWDEGRALEVGIPPDRLPNTGAATEILGGLADEAANATGLQRGTPVVLGAGDVPGGQIGAGAAGPGEAHLSLGTACYFGITLDRPLLDPGRRLGVLCHVDPERWLLWAEMETGGGAVAWWRELLASAASRPQAEFDIDRLAADVSPDDVDLLFAPWLSGERVPLWDHDARGGFVGLGLHHGPGHLARAIIEGIAYQLRWALEYAEAFGTAVDEVRVIGGAGLGSVLPRVLADVLDRPLVIVADPQSAAARGAAMCAIAGAGESGIDGLASAVETIRRLDPEDHHRAGYERRFEAFKALYPALRGITRSLMRDAQSSGADPVQSARSIESEGNVVDERATPSSPSAG
jgi:xylulokinase